MKTQTNKSSVISAEISVNKCKYNKQKSRSVSQRRSAQSDRASETAASTVLDLDTTKLSLGSNYWKVGHHYEIKSDRFSEVTSVSLLDHNSLYEENPYQSSCGYV